jgi:hypothetical protein
MIAALIVSASLYSRAGAGSAMASYARVTAIALVLLHLARQRLNPEAYRALADLALVLPLPLIWCS